MAKSDHPRRTQAERRATSRRAVLESACCLFGAKGYHGTSVEEIAAECGLTARPIYHYFGSKKALFAAANERMEARIVAAMDEDSDGSGSEDIVANWRTFLALCRDPVFHRIVLIDSRNVLGTGRWATSPLSDEGDGAGEVAAASSDGQAFRAALLNRVVMSAFVDAALMIGEAADPAMAEREAEALMVGLFSRLRGHLSVPIPSQSTPDVQPEEL